MLIHRLLWIGATVGGLILVACGDTTEPAPADAPPALLAEIPAESTEVAYITTPCPVTIPNGSMPAGETNRTAPVNHGNGEIWIALWTGGKVVFRPDGPGDMFSSGAMSMPFPWWSRARGNLTIQGRRLDAPSEFPMGPWDKGDVGDDGFFMRTITFPSEGCWEVTGSVGDVSLNFVTLVVREDEEEPELSPTPVASFTTPCPVTEPNRKRPPGTLFLPGLPREYHRSGDIWTQFWDDGKVVFTRDPANRILSSGAMMMPWSWWWAVDGRPQERGETLTIKGRRLDAPASPLRTGVPGRFYQGYQRNTLIFPTEGCWEVTGTVGDGSLTFVTLVVREGALTPTTPEPNFSDVLMLKRNTDGSGSTIRQIDLYNGADVPGFAPIEPSDSGSFGSTGFVSEDGSMAATIEFRGKVCSNYAGGGGCSPAGAVLHLIDLKAWNEALAPLPGIGVVQSVVFSPDAGRVTLSYLERATLGRQETSTLMVFDVDTGAAVARRALGFRPSLLEYSSDGTDLVAYGAAEGPILGISKPGPPQVALLDANTLEVKWELQLADVVSGSWCSENCKESYQDMSFVDWGPAVVLSKDRRRLHIVHAADERITTVDLTTRTLLDTEIRLARSWAERFLDLTAAVVEAKPAAEGVVRTAALSLDETRIYVLTRESDESRWFSVVDIATGRSSAPRETEATGIRVILDGKFLLLDGGVESEHRTEVLDADSLQDVASLVEWHVRAGRDLAGRPIVLAQQFKETTTWVAVLDPETFEVVDGWAVFGIAWWVTP